MHRSPGPDVARSQRWLARLSFVLAGLAVVVLVVFAGVRSFAILAVVLVGAVLTLGAAYLFLSRRGAVRWVSAVVAVLASSRSQVTPAKVLCGTRQYRIMSACTGLLPLRRPARNAGWRG